MKVTNLFFLEWIPNNKSESIKSYTERLIKNHKITKHDVIVGLSFGGLIAQEISKLTPVNNIIFISSFRDKNAIKTSLQFLLNLRLYYLLPNFKINWFDKFALQFFSIKSKEGKEGLLDMMKKTDPKLIKWSLRQIQKYVHDPKRELTIYNIIGTNDKLLKNWRLPNNNFPIKNGGHLMVYENAKEVNETLKKILTPISST